MISDWFDPELTGELCERLGGKQDACHLYWWGDAISVDMVTNTIRINNETYTSPRVSDLYAAAKLTRTKVKQWSRMRDITNFCIGVCSIILLIVLPFTWKWDWSTAASVTLWFFILSGVCSVVKGDD